MKRIADYTQSELANMTADELGNVIEVEAMVAGVSKPAELPPMEYQPTEYPPGKQVFALGVDKTYGGPVYWPCVFGSMEDAKKVADLAEQLAIGDFEHNSYGRSTWKPGEIRSVTVAAMNLPDTQTARVYDLRNKAAKEANTAAEQARNEIQKDAEKYEEVASRCRSLWYSARQSRDDAARFYATRARFVELAGGDTAAAERFLVEKYGAEVVRDTIEAWPAPKA